MITTLYLSILRKLLNTKHGRNSFRIFVRVMENEDIDIRQLGNCGKGYRPSHLGIRLSPENWQKLLEAREYLRNDVHLVERRRRVKKKYPLVWGMGSMHLLHHQTEQWMCGYGVKGKMDVHGW